jgi:rod shape-determining protein MreC
MAWYGHRRSGEPRPGARAVVVGLGLSMVGVLAIQTSTAVRSGIDASRRSMDGTTASLATFASGISGWSFFGLGGSEEDKARIAELEAQIRDLTRWKDLAETMAIRMERYERLLDLVGETQGQSVTARVVAEETGPFSASRIANAGAANGVREGFAVVNENGLVGRVVRVGEYTSRILMLTDFASRIPVMGTLLGRPRPAGRRQRFWRPPARTGNAGQDRSPAKSGSHRAMTASSRSAFVSARPARIGDDVAHRPRDGRARRVDYVRLVPPPDFAVA